MNINIPKLIRPVELADYAKELKPGLVHVWVNPPRDVLNAYSTLYDRSQQARDDLQKAKPDDTEVIHEIMAEMAKIGNEFAEWYSQLWSQHADEESHLTPDAVRQLAALETDPAFYQWLARRSWGLINEHRMISQKK